MKTRRANALALEKLLSTLMLVGVTVTAISLIAGLVFWLIHRDTPAGTWLLRFGLMALMATPILRIALAVAESIRLKDSFFTATTAVVLLLLMLTLAKAFWLAA